jgi:hypothetical protein
VRRIWPVLALALASSSASANQYYYSFDGNDYPENEGWNRTQSQPPAQRRLEDGSLVIDSTAQFDIYDLYWTTPPNGFDPDPGETFVARWRLRVDVVLPDFVDPNVRINSDDRYAVNLAFGLDRVYSISEPNKIAHFEAGAFHDYELRSNDMRHYALFLDTELAMEGLFQTSSFPPELSWGDATSAKSVAYWDSFEYGVVPEPGAAGTVWFMIAVGATACRRGLLPKI